MSEGRVFWVFFFPFKSGTGQILAVVKEIREGQFYHH